MCAAKRFTFLPPGGDCKYTIRRYDKATCAVELYYDLMDLEQTGSCNSAYLEIDGKRFCNMPVNQIQKINFNEPQNEKVLTFHADRNALSNRGFSLRVRQVTDCAVQDRPCMYSYCDYTELVYLK